MGNRMMSVALAGVLLALGAAAVADMEPVDPRFGDSITQSVYGPTEGGYWSYGLRVVRTAGATTNFSVYIENVTGVGDPVPGTDVRDADGYLIERWYSDFSGAIEVTLENFLAEERESGPADFIGTRIQNVLSDESGRPRLAREWLYVGDGLESSVLDEVYAPVGGGGWETWDDGWYFSSLSADGGQWTTMYLVPVPGAALLGALGLGLVVRLRRR